MRFRGKSDNTLGDESWKKITLSGPTEYEMHLAGEIHISQHYMLMQISGFLSYQKTKFANQLFSFEFNTEKSNGSIAIAVKEVSDSCAAAVCLT